MMIKRCARKYGHVVAILLAYSLFAGEEAFCQAARPEEGVTDRSGTVTEGPNVNETKADKKTPHKIVPMGAGTLIQSNVLTPPGKKTFKEFPSPRKRRAFIEKTAGHISDVVNPNALKKVGVEIVTADPTNAASFPLQAHGNLTGGGGGGTGTGKGSHWAVKLDGCAVTKIVWEAIDSPLTANSHPSGTVGKRIFPGKTSNTDKKTRDTVTVKATISPPLAGIKVFFKFYDVDDPSATAAPVDTTDTAAGVKGSDNRGDLGKLTPDEATTDSKGIATVIFKVALQPGDNFRVAATCSKSEFTKLDNDKVPGSDAQVSSFKGKITELLTVWRKLHMEIDRMAPITGNTIKGKIVRITNRTKEVKVDVKLDKNDASRNLDSRPSGNGRFELGTMTVGAVSGKTLGNGGDFLRFTNAPKIPYRATHRNGTTVITGNIIDLRLRGGLRKGTQVIVDKTFTGNFAGGTMKIEGVAAAVRISKSKGRGRRPRFILFGKVQPVFTLIDDDSIKDGQSVPFPDTSTMTSKFAHAYVLPVNDLPGTSTVPLVLNVNHLSNSALVNATRWNSASFNKPTFWIVYALGAHQIGNLADNDPKLEAKTVALGITSSNNKGRSIVFEEMFIETGYITAPDRPETTAHEILHALGGVHQRTNNSFLMFTPKPRGAVRSLSPRSLATIRDLSKPEGP